MSSPSRRWLVNDSLGQITGSRTLWHDLRDCCDCKPRVGQPFIYLAEALENDAEISFSPNDRWPDVIVRNATYFRRLNSPRRTKVISIAQDILPAGPDRDMQADVIAHSDAVVFNSEYTKEKIGCPAGVRSEVIPIGTDFSAFYPLADEKREEIRRELSIPPDSILFVGSAHPVKGWDLLNEIIDRTNYHFVLVTKDDSRIKHPRVTNFGCVPQSRLAVIMNACAALLCTSRQETQHLAGIEAMACGLPVVAPPVGIYPQLLARESLSDWPDTWSFGEIVDDRHPESFIFAIGKVLRFRFNYAPREFALSAGLDLKTCMDRWERLLAEMEGGNSPQ